MVYITYFDIDAQYYGWIFAFNVFGLMAVSLGNRRWVHRYSLESLLTFALIIATAAAFILAAAAKLGVGGVVIIVITVFIFLSMNGIIAATATAAALDTVPGLTGSASALIGALQYGSGILSSLLLVLINDGTPWTMAWIIALFSLVSAIMALTAYMPKACVKQP